MGWSGGFVFPIDDDVRMVVDAARQFAEQEVLPLAAEIDRNHRFPSELIPKLAKLGFFGVCVPSEFSGSALSHFAYALIVEELAAACASTAIIVSAHNSLCVWPILTYGTPLQRSKYLPSLALGEALGCFALSEPGTGSDAGNLSCTVRREGDDFVVNGTKNWITNAPDAGTCVLFANQDPAAGNKGITAFVHPLPYPGVSVGKKEDKLGIRASSTASITYDGARFSRDHLLGDELRGFSIAMNTLNGGRIGVAAQAVGIARAALRDALAYAQQRKTFGKVITEHQSIQNYLADMIVGIDAARYLTLGAATLKDQGASYSRQAAMAKLFASETAVECSLRGIQIHGGYGYVTEYPAERHLRDAKITEIYEGTSEIQRLVIASHLSKEDY